MKYFTEYVSVFPLHNSGENKYRSKSFSAQSIVLEPERSRLE